MDVQAIALVAGGSGVNPKEVMQVAGALQTQITRDFQPVWGAAGTVACYARLEDVPPDAFVIELVRSLAQTTLEGYHYFDTLSHPHSIVRTDDPHWSLTASHECLEMLADPSGQRTEEGLAPGSDPETVRYLMEICDPCQHIAYAYGINGYPMSDFYGPNYFDSSPATGERYSLTGKLPGPRQILPGGYLCFADQSGAWTKLINSGGSIVSVPVTGVYGRSKLPIRERIDRHSRRNKHYAPTGDIDPAHDKLRDQNVRAILEERKRLRREGRQVARLIRAYRKGSRAR